LSQSRNRSAVLIVDDNRDSADSLAMLMEITGNKTYLAHDGVEAVEAIEKYRPEVVLLDIGLPGWTDMKSAGACASNRGAKTSS
jgi:CheY-like chemotaxis protein